MNPVKLFSFDSSIHIDLRSKIPKEVQLRDQLRMHLIDRILFFDKPFPSVETISETIHISAAKVEIVLKQLAYERLLYYKDNHYYASYPKFTLPFKDQSKSLMEALENNGIQPSMKRHQSIILNEKALKKLKIPFEKGIQVHETRIDYYGDGLPFAVTYNYTPTVIIEDIDKVLESHVTINDFYKPHTKTLTKNYAMDSVIYPGYVSDFFNIPYGKAGILIKSDYYDDQGQLANSYRGYINGWFSIHCEGPNQ